MSGKLIDKNGNTHDLSDEEMIEAQAAVIKLREKRAKKKARNDENREKERVKSDAKIAEMRAREEIKTEREERRAAIKSREKAEAAERQRVTGKEKRAADREVAKERAKEQRRKSKERAKAAEFAAAQKIARAAERIERDRGRSGALGEARDDRLKDRQLRDLEKRIKAVDLEDTKKWMRLRGDRRSHASAVEMDAVDRWEPLAPELGEFLDWDVMERMERILDYVDLDSDDPAELAEIGIALDAGDLAVSCDHPAIRERLGCGPGYEIAFRGHPQASETYRAVWIGDTARKCIIFSLPIDDPSPE